MLRWVTTSARSPGGDPKEETQGRRLAQAHHERPQHRCCLLRGAGTRRQLRALRSSAAQSSEERRANKRPLVGVRAHRTVSAGEHMQADRGASRGTTGKSCRPAGNSTDQQKGRRPCGSVLADMEHAGQEEGLQGPAQAHRPAGNTEACSEASTGISRNGACRRHPLRKGQTARGRPASLPR